jgi:quercetin dioxygenase-like cupin family protein
MARLFPDQSQRITGFEGVEADRQRNGEYNLRGTITFNPPLTVRENVFSFEELAKREKQVPIETKHYFSKGIYAREVTIPAGVICTGHIHKYTNLNIISKGKIEVLIDYELQTFEAPATIISPPGTKRIVRALEETVWTTIHATDETNIDKIEQEFIAHTEAEYLEFQKQLLLEF